MVKLPNLLTRFTGPQPERVSPKQDVASQTPAEAATPAAQNKPLRSDYLAGSVESQKPGALPPLSKTVVPQVSEAALFGGGDTATPDSREALVSYIQGWKTRDPGAEEGIAAQSSRVEKFVQKVDTKMLPLLATALNLQTDGREPSAKEVHEAAEKMCKTAHRQGQFLTVTDISLVSGCYPVKEGREFVKLTRAQFDSWLKNQGMANDKWSVF
jgi:hypothetical protein